MLGDSWVRDVLGAVAAGIPAIWIAGDRVLPEALPRVTSVSHLREVRSRIG